MDYLTLKWIHILSSTLLFGTGIGSAFFKFLADRNGNLQNIAQTNKNVVIADWLFTTPAAIVQPITGIMLTQVLGFPLSSSWLAVSITLYLFVGACWLPVVYLQIRMSKLSNAAIVAHVPLTPEYQRMARLWFWLGVPAFIAMIGIFYLMVCKPVLWR